MSFGVQTLTFIALPLIAGKFFEVGVIEFAIDYFRVVIVNDSFAMKLIFQPTTLIGDFAFGIEESSEAVHEIIFPLSVINASVLIIKFSIAVSELIFDKSFIFGSIFIFFNEKRGLFSFKVRLLLRCRYDCVFK